MPEPSKWPSPNLVCRRHPDKKLSGPPARPAKKKRFTADGKRIVNLIAGKRPHSCRPADVVARFAACVKPGGVLLASLYAPSLKTIRKSIREIDQSAPWSHTFSVTHEQSCKTWVIKAWGVGDPAAASP